MGVKFGERYASRVVGASPARWSCPRDMFACMTGLCPGALRAATGLVFAAGLTAQSVPHDAHELGTVDFRVSCAPRVQAEFNTAVALLHHMTYPDASRAFARVAATDSACAMAYWGMAMTLFQPLWPTRPGPEALARGWQLTRRAEMLQPATERERLLVAAARAFFLFPDSTDYWLRIRRWEAAMERVYVAFPDDDEAASFYALALLAASPPGNAAARAHADSAAGILLRVYRRNPRHPGAMHYLVHANDVPGRAGQLLSVTHRYDSLAPDNPHALHMPTHIYTRLGDWDAVIAGNVRAAEAALAHPAGPRGEFVWDEFPHALEYLIYAYLQEGADDRAAAALARLRGTERLEPTFKTAFHLASTGSRYVLERRAWSEAAALVPREPAALDWDRFPWAEAIVQFSRGLGAAHSRDSGTARAASERLVTLEARARQSGEVLFAQNIRILGLELDAWRAHVAGYADSAVALMRGAAELEDSTPKHAVTPAPTLPADELLGDLLLEVHRPAEALVAYQRSIALYPNRFNGLLGAARAARAVARPSAARGYYRQLLSVGRCGSRNTALREARVYMGTSRPSGPPRLRASCIPGSAPDS